MALKFYNTLTGKKEIFKPFKNKKVNFFVCGPTVYDFSHIGHARTYIAFDALVKYLKKIGYSVFYLQNITDIDDKIIERAKQEKVSFKDLSKRFEKEYLKDMKDLRVDSVDQYARAADYIKEIISQVERLLEKGFAYQISDGIYYDIKKFKDYGKLSKRTAQEAEDAVSRIDEAKEKRNKGDFCLWKISKPNEPKWKSPFGEGRPGWHIEDTAITEKYFGPQYDIHGGANELIFPHHEAEIAQMEAVSGKKPLVKYWTHTGLLTVNGIKMSKSLKNFISISEFLKNHSSRILRLFILKSHYRSPIDYNEKAIKQTEKELERIDEFVEKIRHPERSEGSRIKRPAAGFFGRSLPSSEVKGPQNDIAKKIILKTKKYYQSAMADDFNTPKALAAIFDLVKKGNKLIEQNKLSAKQAQEIYNLMLKFDKVLGILPIKKKLVIPQEIKKLVQKREKARQVKDWARADQIRQQIKKKGYKTEDTLRGPKIKKAK
ncbi:MAG: cysteine--tRNA ligase [Candidatus Portnoybacteria bacterium RIFCSPLOWO2_01_FULL_43_11]|uniref:Cysteine--tRNA ligase n=2 Tax=Candidatus Portnoyibacteriota TaxID=1817913 RepID=A0A1G2FB13_9BACT|nr:MAG: cysteine--tRNA ligase [Candidatus Portnoybacteria bacterium RIFCSPHIGHO2_01_FULL_40_12b]OGZ37298.1 MAG: cysteine--tRNA ligase [Candidatus Portnoybacteria bacterium RIFCSPHIGHO2_02_FULL_40_23]OGZ38373.1 MAG: cysteine--tRNA ligase [Candidatus Portnoybacteria bacterium RIFCSPLOWO2_01_FULL_43_11]